MTHNIPQRTIDTILELSKLNNTVDNIVEKTSVEYKDVIKILVENNTKTMIGLKQIVTRNLKVIELSKTIDERGTEIDKINISINNMYDNFKWVVDNFIINCSQYYNDNTLGTQIAIPSTADIKKLIESIKRTEQLALINFEPNEIVQFIVHINKIRKSTISKRLPKIQAETKKDSRKLLRLDIQDVVDEMYMIYKWLTEEYVGCIENIKIGKELEEEENKSN